MQTSEKGTNVAFAQYAESSLTQQSVHNSMYLMVATLFSTLLVV